MDETARVPVLTVNEIYHSIQGESSWAGRPCVFVRLTGCNLRCTYCDTEYAFYDGQQITISDIVDRVMDFGVPLVEITGGEPLLQPGTAELAGLLQEAGLTVLVETSGALPINILPAGVIRIMDLKCPSSGECEKNYWDNIVHLTDRDEVKFVIGDRADYDWARGTLTKYELTSRCGVLFSTVHGALDPRHLTEWVLNDKLEVRVQLQMHKYIWTPETRSV